MRTIKFRGKTTNGEWVYGHYSTGGFIHTDGTETVRHLIHADMLYDVDENTVGQFTGLVDMNGREIFENDVIGVNGIPAGIVSWHYNGYYFIDDKLGEHLVSNSYRPLGEMIEYSKRNKINFEVIGNIHDNPELITNK